jgi:protein-L-isoaspartate(D-aspartate) O-methyltransferase
MGVFDHGSRTVEKRLAMVEHQLKARGIFDQAVLRAMAEVPREHFLPEEYSRDAYSDGPLPIGEGQTISQPYMVAIMTECLMLTGNDKVLEIGTGSGYQMAVLLKITPWVYSIERIPGLARSAQAKFHELGYDQVHIRVADGSCGWPEEAPFDAIIVTSGAPVVPETLKEQLAEGGRLVIPVGSRHTQVLYKITRTGDRYRTEEKTHCVFVPLIGKYAWAEGSELKSM